MVMEKCGVCKKKFKCPCNGMPFTGLLDEIPCYYKFVKGKTSISYLSVDGIKTLHLCSKKCYDEYEPIRKKETAEVMEHLTFVHPCCCGKDCGVKEFKATELDKIGSNCCCGEHH